MGCCGRICRARGPDGCVDSGRALPPRIYADKNTDFGMTTPTLVIADYPVGFTSGFGETLYNLFSGFPNEKLWCAHPAHVAPAEGKRRGQSINLPSPARPRWLPQRISLAYYPLLKVQQFRESREAVRLLAGVVQKHSIKNLLVIPVSPWIMSAALALHKQYA